MRLHSGDADIQFKGTTITFLGTVAGNGGTAESITVTGNAVFGNAGTDTVTGIDNLKVTGTLGLNTTNITGTGAFDIDGLTTIADGITAVIDSGTGTGNIDLAAVTAGDAVGQNLSLDAGTNNDADITIAGTVTNIDTLLITAAGQLTLGGAVTVDTLNITSGVDDVTWHAGGTITNAVTFSNTGILLSKQSWITFLRVIPFFSKFKWNY